MTPQQKKDAKIRWEVTRLINCFQPFGSIWRHYADVCWSTNDVKGPKNNTEKKEEKNMNSWILFMFVLRK